MIRDIALLSEIELEVFDKIGVENMSEGRFIELVYSKAYYDLEFFTDYFLSHMKQKDGVKLKTPFFHKEIWKALDYGENVNCIIPRGHGKTTSVIFWIIHALIYGKCESILYIASSSLGEESIGKIKQELETNDKIKDIYGNLIPEDLDKKKDRKSKKWRQKELELLNGSRIQTISKGMTVRGKRPQKIIFDDPQENKDVENRNIVAKFNNWVFSSLYNTLLPGGSIVTLGTVIGNLCLIKYLRDEKKWMTIQYEACDENYNNILWSDMWTEKDLTQRKSDIGTAIFNQEFRNIALSKEDTLIKEYWIRYWEYIPEDFDYTVMAIDPAISEKESGDFTGISVAGFKDDKIYFLYAKQHKLSPNSLIELIHGLNEKYEPNKIVYEKNKEETLGHLLYRDDLPIDLIHAHRDKRSRLMSVAGKIEFGDVYFARDMDELVFQLTNFPDLEHDDVMDSAVYCLMEKDGFCGSRVMVC